MVTFKILGFYTFKVHNCNHRFFILFFFKFFMIKLFEIIYGILTEYCFLGCSDSSKEDKLPDDQGIGLHQRHSPVVFLL